MFSNIVKNLSKPKFKTIIYSIVIFLVLIVIINFMYKKFKIEKKISKNKSGQKYEKFNSVNHNIQAGFYTLGYNYNVFDNPIREGFENISKELNKESDDIEEGFIFGLFSSSSSAPPDCRNGENPEELRKYTGDGYGCVEQNAVETRCRNYMKSKGRTGGCHDKCKFHRNILNKNEHHKNCAEFNNNNKMCKDILNKFGSGSHHSGNVSACEKLHRTGRDTGFSLVQKVSHDNKLISYINTQNGYQKNDLSLSNDDLIDAGTNSNFNNKVFFIVPTNNDNTYALILNNKILSTARHEMVLTSQINNYNNNKFIIRPFSQERNNTVFTIQYYSTRRYCRAYSKFNLLIDLQYSATALMGCWTPSKNRRKISPYDTMNNGDKFNIIPRDNLYSDSNRHTTKEGLYNINLYTARLARDRYIHDAGSKRVHQYAYLYLVPLETGLETYYVKRLQKNSTNNKYSLEFDKEPNRQKTVYTVIKFGNKIIRGVTYDCYILSSSNKVYNLELIYKSDNINNINSQFFNNNTNVSNVININNNAFDYCLLKIGNNLLYYTTLSSGEIVLKCYSDSTNYMEESEIINKIKSHNADGRSSDKIDILFRIHRVDNNYRIGTYNYDESFYLSNNNGLLCFMNTNNIYFTPQLYDDENMVFITDKNENIANGIGNMGNRITYTALKKNGENIVLDSGLKYSESYRSTGTNNVSNFYIKTYLLKNNKINNDHLTTIYADKNQIYDIPSTNKQKLHKHDKLNIYKETNCKKNNTNVNNIDNCYDYSPLYLDADNKLTGTNFENDSGLNGKLIGDVDEYNNISIKECSNKAIEKGSNYNFSHKKYNGRSHKNNHCIVGLNSSIMTDDKEYDTYSKTSATIKRRITQPVTTRPLTNPTQINLQDSVLSVDASREACDSNSNYYYKGDGGCLQTCVRADGAQQCSASSLRTIGSINDFNIEINEVNNSRTDSSITVSVNVTNKDLNSNFYPAIIGPTNAIKAIFIKSDNQNQGNVDVDYTLDYRNGDLNRAIFNSNNSNNLTISIPSNYIDFDALKLSFTDIYGITSDEINVNLLQYIDSDGNVVVPRVSQNSNNIIRSDISNNQNRINSLGSG